MTRVASGTIPAVAIAIAVLVGAGSAAAGDSTAAQSAAKPDFSAAADCVGPGLTVAQAAADMSQGMPDSSQAHSDTTSALPAAAKTQKEFPHPDLPLMERLRAGGYLIVFRHSITDWAQRDQDGENFEDRTVQRNLNKEGEAQAARIGKAMAGLRIPIGMVLSSPMWRCRDTAQIAFGRHEPDPELFRRGPEHRAIRLRLLSTEPEAGKNVVLVTHQDLLIPIVEGLRRDQLKEGDAFIVKPLGEGKFEILAQVTPEDWERLAAADKPVAKDGKAAKPPKKTAQN